MLEDSRALSAVRCTATASQAPGRPRVREQRSASWSAFERGCLSGRQCISGDTKYWDKQVIAIVVLLARLRAFCGGKPSR